MVSRFTNIYSPSPLLIDCTKCFLPWLNQMEWNLILNGSEVWLEAFFPCFSLYNLGFIKRTMLENWSGAWMITEIAAIFLNNPIVCYFSRFFVTFFFYKNFIINYGSDSLWILLILPEKCSRKTNDYFLPKRCTFLYYFHCKKVSSITLAYVRAHILSKQTQKKYHVRRFRAQHNAEDMCTNRIETENLWKKKQQEITCMVRN